MSVNSQCWHRPSRGFPSTARRFDIHDKQECPGLYETGSAEFALDFLVPVYYFQVAAPEDLLGRLIAYDSADIGNIWTKKHSESRDPLQFMAKTSAPIHEVTHYRTLVGSNFGHFYIYHFIRDLHAFLRALNNVRVKAPGMPLGSIGQHPDMCQYFKNRFRFNATWSSILDPGVRPYDNDPRFLRFRRDNNLSLPVPYAFTDTENGAELWPLGAVPFIEAQALYCQLGALDLLGGNNAALTYWQSDKIASHRYYNTISNLLDHVKDSFLGQMSLEYRGAIVDYCLNGDVENGDPSEELPGPRLVRLIESSNPLAELRRHLDDRGWVTREYRRLARRYQQFLEVSPQSNDLLITYIRRILRDRAAILRLRMEYPDIMYNFKAMFSAERNLRLPIPPIAFSYDETSERLIQVVPRRFGAAGSAVMAATFMMFFLSIRNQLASGSGVRCAFKEGLRGVPIACPCGTSSGGELFVDSEPGCIYAQVLDSMTPTRNAKIYPIEDWI